MATENTFRDRFLDSHDRFQAAMLAAIKAHHEGVIVFNQSMGKLDTLQESVGELQESVGELKHLIMEQGAQITAQGAEIKALREREEH